MIQLERHSEKAHLFHITTESCLESILREGIRASEYGDLEVDGNGGYGVYAVRDAALHASLLQELGSFGERLFAIRFETAGEWYECTGETAPEDSEEDGDFEPCHIGYVVLPYDIAPRCIKRVDPVR